VSISPSPCPIATSPTRSGFQPQSGGEGIELLKRLGVPVELSLRPLRRLQGIILSIEHAIGSDKLQLPGQIVTVLREPVGKPLHHGFDHGLAVGRAFLELERVLRFPILRGFPNLANSGSPSS